jgi:hypothetical protein
MAARRPRGGGGGPRWLLPPLLALLLVALGASASAASASTGAGVGTTTAAPPSPFAAASHRHDHDHHDPHMPCGHSRVAHISRRLSELHSEQQQRDRRRRRSRSLLEAAAPPGNATDDGALLVASSTSRRRRRLHQDPPQSAEKLPIRIWVEYQGLGELSDAQRDKLTRTVGLSLGVLRKYLAVRRPVAGRLRVRPLCVMWSSAGYCLKYSPDVLDGGGSGGSEGSSLGSTAAGPGAAVSMSTFFGGGMGGSGGGAPLFGSDGEALPTLGKENNQCGLASINGSHVAPYRQCQLGGGGCREYAGGEGEPTDYYLYITAVQDEHCRSGAVAWGLPCLYDQDTNRPVLGSANMCPYALQEGGASPGRDQSVAVLVHELMHALVRD